MIAPIYPAASAAPLLFLALQKIARTPTSRLRCGYHVTARYQPCLGWRAHNCRVGHAVTDKSLRPLGQGMLIDRYLAGGIVGTQLPLSIAGAFDTRPLANLALDAAHHAEVISLDVWA
ncbi:MAG: hypothetical protein JSS27_05745 [Planctomycetes bacterium]|nr:hypothetical protein [Planctomycetota bacterium]